MFVCHGNICRSPMAEFIFRKKLSDSGISDAYWVSSAATSTEEIGNPVYPPACRELAAHGISCKGKQAVQVVASDYGLYDYIIVMDDRNIRNLKKLIGSDPEGKVWKLLDFSGFRADVKPYFDVERLGGADISDPWYTGDFRTTYNDIVEGCDGLLAYLETE